MYKKSWLTCLCYVVLNQVQYINLSEIVRALKAVAIVTRVHLNISMIFVVSLFLSAKDTNWWTKASVPWVEVVRALKAV